jgi:hypothetical protein
MIKKRDNAKPSINENRIAKSKGGLRRGLKMMPQEVNSALAFT